MYAPSGIDTSGARKLSLLIHSAIIFFGPSSGSARYRSIQAGFSIMCRGNAPDQPFDLPLRSIADVEAVERLALEQRLGTPNFAARIARALAARDPGDAAITYVADGRIETSPQVISFGAFRAHVNRTAALLRSRNVGRQDAVAILLPAVPQLWWSVIAALSVGVVFPVNWMLEAKQLGRLLEEARVKAVIALGPTPGFEIWESVAAIAGRLSSETPIWSVPGPDGGTIAAHDLDTQAATQPDRPIDGLDAISGDDIAAYIHSGGTTGLPKIVKLSHRNIAYRHWTLELALKSEPGEVILHDTPMFHVGGLTGRCLPPVASGASVVIPSVMGARDRTYIDNYWKFVEKYQITRLSGVPTTLAQLTKKPPSGEDLSSLKPYFITGSTAMPVPVRQLFERLAGVRVLNSYGMTENTASIALDPRDGPTKEGSSGIRLPYTQIRTVAMNDVGKVVRDCTADEIGMILVRSPGLTPGYLDPSHDRTNFTEDGWLVTGDLGRIDSDGYIFVTGRAKDVIIRGGHNIDPALIEEPLLTSPDVLLAAAVGKPDSYAGELPVAYVQLVAGSCATPEDLSEFLRARIVERAAMPKEIIILDKLPLTAVGKPLKTLLRRDAAERTFLTEIAAGTGLDPHNGELSVTVEPNPVHGMVAVIALRDGHGVAREPLVGRIRAIMQSYVMAYTIAWDVPAAAKREKQAP
jgi:fatty-acyl-CoA synthase